MKAVIVTGTPGTGKTTLAKKLAKMYGMKYIDVNEVIGEQGLSAGFDEERDCEVIDTERLNRVLIGMIQDSEKTPIIDSHMSHFLPKRYVKLCLITKCSLGELKKRLSERGYSEKKIRENMDADIFDICLNEAKDAGHRIKIVDTDKLIDYGDIKKDLNNS